MRRRSAMLVLLMLLSGCREVLVHDLDEPSANRVQLSLLSAGVDARKSRNGERWSIEVAAEDLTAALEIVEASRAIHRQLPQVAAGELSMLMSREERAEVMLRTRELLLARTLEGLPEVLEARVHVGGAKRESASVVVVAAREVPGATDEIRAVTAASLGIAPPQINVLLRIEPPRRVPRVEKRSPQNTVLYACGAVALVAILLVRTAKRTPERVAIETVEAADVF